MKECGWAGAVMQNPFKFRDYCEMRGKTIVATILHIGRNVKVGSYHMQLTSGKIDVVQIKRRRAEV